LWQTLKDPSFHNIKEELEMRLSYDATNGIDLVPVVNQYINRLGYVVGMCC